MRPHATTRPSPALLRSANGLTGHAQQRLHFTGRMLLLLRPLPQATRPVAAAAIEELAGDAAAGNSLFTPQFMSVLKTSLERSNSPSQGPASSSNYKPDQLHHDFVPASQRPRPAPMSTEQRPAEVEMVEACMAHCVERLQTLEKMQKMVERSIDAEMRQLQRLKFVADKAGSSAAYARSLKELLRRKEQETSSFRGATGSMIEAWDSEEEFDETLLDTARIGVEAVDSLGNGLSGAYGSYASSSGAADGAPFSAPAASNSWYDAAPAAANGFSSSYNGATNSYNGAATQDQLYGSNNAAVNGFGGGSSTAGLQHQWSDPPVRSASPLRSGSPFKKRAVSPMRGRGEGGMSRQRGAKRQ